MGHPYREGDFSTLPHTKIQPLYNQCVVLRDIVPERIGNIILPDVVRERLQTEATRGVVLRVGPGRIEYKKNVRKQTLPTGRRVPMSVRRGDIVWFHHRAGAVETAFDVCRQIDVEEHGRRLTVMWDDEIMAIDGDRRDELEFGDLPDLAEALTLIDERFAS